MNQDQIVSIITKLIIGLCAGVAAKYGFSDTLPGLAATIAPAVLAVLTFAYSHWYNATPADPAEPKATSGTGTSRLLLFGFLLSAFGFALSGCTLERSKVTINTPAVYNLLPGTNGVPQTNLVSAARVTTTVQKERLWLPESYALFLEDDIYGIDITMTSQSSSLPNIKAGIAHSSKRWVPTSTNELYAAAMSASGAVNNKAIPFWMSTSGQFTAGKVRVTQGTDTNGAATVDVSAIVPGTPVTQTPPK